MDAEHVDEAPSRALPALLPSYHELLSAMIWEVQANRVVLDRLSLRYTMFRFTGGSIPAEQWNTNSIASHLTRSSKAACIATKDLKRYLALIGTLALLQLGVAMAGPPRTLRDRCFITDEFSHVQSEIMSLGSHLQSAIGRALDAPELLS